MTHCAPLGISRESHKGAAFKWATKLQGRWVESNCGWISVQPVLHAPVEPGKQNITVLFAIPARARDWIVDDPISVKDTARNISPNPSTVLSNKGLNASGVQSRSVKPVPPVVMMGRCI